MKHVLFAQYLAIQMRELADRLELLDVPEESDITRHVNKAITELSSAVVHAMCASPGPNWIQACAMEYGDDCDAPKKKRQRNLLGRIGVISHGTSSNGVGTETDYGMHGTWE